MAGCARRAAKSNSGCDRDSSFRLGVLKNIHLSDLVFNRPGKIEVHTNTDGLIVKNVKVNHATTPNWHLVAIGPKSQTWKGPPGTDPSRWREIFSPDLDCTVRNVIISGVRARDLNNDLPIDQIVCVIERS